jgi:hypothetical protein
MTNATRVSPKYVWDKLHSSSDTLLVCAYEDAEKCRKHRIDGAIDMEQFKTRLLTSGKQREIVFYCS